MPQPSLFYVGVPMDPGEATGQYWQEQLNRPKGQTDPNASLLRKYLPGMFRQQFGSPLPLQPGLDGQADDRTTVDKGLMEKYGKPAMKAVGDSAYGAWQDWLNFQQNGSLADKILDPGLNRRLGIFQEGKPALSAAPEGK